MEIQRTINDKVEIPFDRINDYKNEYIQSIKPTTIELDLENITQTKEGLVIYL